MLRLIPCLLLLGCNGEPDVSTASGRSECEEICWQRELITCRDLCDRDCGADDMCRDACHGDCLSRYDTCVGEECD